MEDSKSSGQLSLSLRAVAAASGLVAMTSLTALVIAVSVRQVDVLSIVALALAILAFAIQIIVFAIQAADSAAASRRSLSLHAELSSLLSELRERTGTTQKSVDSINERLLEAIIGKAKVGGVGFSAESFAERVAADYTRATASESSLASTAKAQLFPEPLPKSIAAEVHGELDTWPLAEDVSEITNRLEALTEDARFTLVRLANDAHYFTRPEAGTGPGLTVLDPSELLEAGLIEKIPGWQLYTLSSMGRGVARVFTAAEPAPDWVSPLMEMRATLRARLADWSRPLSNRD